MATKIRGFSWAYNYRGFDVYTSRKSGPITWLVVPSQNLINKDLATEEHTHRTNDGMYVWSLIDQHWEVIDAREAEAEKAKANA